MKMKYFKRKPIRKHSPRGQIIGGKRFNENHYNWKGDKISEKGGRGRALFLYPNIGKCSICGNLKTERHHIDGNTVNNDSSNIKIVCRKCHMKLDKRLNTFIQMAKKDKGIFGRIAARKSKLKNQHCPKGHLYSGVNINGTRICKICMKIHRANYLNKLKNLSIIENKIYKENKKSEV